MALAAVDDVVTRLGRPLTTQEQTRADPGLLEEASVLVLAYLNQDEGLDEWPVTDPVTPVPSAVVIVTSRMVARVLDQDAAVTRPVGAESVTQAMGPFSESYNFGAGSTSGSPWLTLNDKVQLKRHRFNGGQVSVPMSTGQTGLYRRVVR